MTDEEREQLVRWERRRKSSQALALRSRIVLKCAAGLANKEVAVAVGVTARLGHIDLRTTARYAAPGPKQIDEIGDVLDRRHQAARRSSGA